MNNPQPRNIRNRIAAAIMVSIALRSFSGSGIEIPRIEINIQKAERWRSGAALGPCDGSIGEAPI